MFYLCKVALPLIQSASVRLLVGHSLHHCLSCMMGRIMIVYSNIYYRKGL